MTFECKASCSCGETVGLAWAETAAMAAYEAGIASVGIQDHLRAGPGHDITLDIRERSA